MKKNCIIIFVKAPKPGFVKTRLAKDLGDVSACEVYQKMAGKIIQEAGKTDADMEIHYYPENEAVLVRNWLGSGVKLVPQQGVDLGDKMANALGETLKKGYEKVILTGSDIPDITRFILETGFLHIEKNPVIGPCRDGGYYLAGFDADSFDPGFFANIQWSTSTVLKETLQIMAGKNSRPFLLPVLNDVDTIEDLHGLAENE